MSLPFNFKKIKEFIAPFRGAISVAVVCVIAFVVIQVVIPTINEYLANKTPIKSIEATNEKEYKVEDKIKEEDFNVIAIHENGRKSHISSSDIIISTKNIRPIGKTTSVTINMKNDESIRCEVKVKTKRKKIVSFTCGYPNIKDVKAVIYSNGELCFEGKGDIMTFDEGKMPWGKYDEQKDYPIKAVSFGKGVAPSNLNYFFEKQPELSYVDKIPNTAQSMVRTFAGCEKLTQTGDWSDCSVLLNITECYADDEELIDIYPIPENVRNATGAFEHNTKLMTPPDMSGAIALVNATEMFTGCKSLVSGTIPPNIVVAKDMYADCINLKDVPALPDTLQDMSGMFRGDVSLENGNVIPANVVNVSNCFAGCEFLSGEIMINCNAQEFGGMFADACIATKVNLVGESFMLDVYANTKKDNVSNIFVNSRQADISINTYDDAVRVVQEQAAAETAALEAEKENTENPESENKNETTEETQDESVSEDTEEDE